MLSVTTRTGLTGKSVLVDLKKILIQPLLSRFKYIPFIDGKRTAELPAIVGSKDQQVPDIAILSPMQQRVFDSCLHKTRPSMFFTGAAGTGKTFLIKHIVKALALEGRNIAVTSSTGISALAIDGTTVHAWAGLTASSIPLTAEWLMRDDKGQKLVVNRISTAMSSRQGAMDRWKQTDTLIIEECSMLQPEVMDLLDMLGRRIRKKRSAFGGLQVILCGDFMQLSPVYDESSVEKYLNALKIHQKDFFPRYCFESKVWPQLTDATLQPTIKAKKNQLDPQRIFVLDRVFRQQDDSFMRSFLHYFRQYDNGADERHNDLRFAAVDAVLRYLALPLNDRQLDPIFKAVSSGIFNSIDDLAPYLKKVSPGRWEIQKSKLTNDDDTAVKINYSKVVRLFPLRNQVQRWNNSELSLIMSPTHRYYSLDLPAMNSTEQLLDSNTKTAMNSISRLESVLDLRVGAQVMLLRNLSLELGLVNGTVGHVEGFEAVYELPIDNDIKIEHSHPVIQELVKHESYEISKVELPRVRFPISKLNEDVKFNSLYMARIEGNFVSMLVLPTTEYIRVPDSESKLSLGLDESETDDENVNVKSECPSRSQIPLSLAWAYSIHKSQGKTLDKVQVDVSSMFAHGQAYVAFSRARSLATLRVVGYDMVDKSKFWDLVRHPKVAKFYEDIV